MRRRWISRKRSRTFKRGWRRWSRFSKKRMGTRMRTWRSKFRSRKGISSNRLYKVSKTRIPRQVASQRLRVRLPYWDVIQMPGAGTDGYSEYVLSLSSVYDPDITGSGHQPRGYDQWANLYNAYRVINCYWTVRFYTSDTNATTVRSIQLLAGALQGPENQEATVSSLVDVMEYPKDGMQQFRRFTRNNTGITGFTSPSDSQSTVIKGSMNTYKMHKYWLNRTPNTLIKFYWPDDWNSSVGFSPSYEYFLTLCVGSMTQGLSGIGVLPLPYVFAEVKLVYDVEFYNFVYPTAS